MHRSRFFLYMVLTLATGCGEYDPIVPAPTNAFVSSVIVERIVDPKTAVSLEDVVEIYKNDGFYIQCGVVPVPDPPAHIGGRGVQPTSDWNLAIVIYPRGSESDYSPHLVRVSNPFSGRGPYQGNGKMLVNQGQSSIWAQGGFNEKERLREPVSPESYKSWKTGKTKWFWSYLNVNRDQVGEYVYEISLLPTARWISPIRNEYGSPVILKRGLLRVVEKSDANTD